VTNNLIPCVEKTLWSFKIIILEVKLFNKFIEDYLWNLTCWEKSKNRFDSAQRSKIKQESLITLGSLTYDWFFFNLTHCHCCCNRHWTWTRDPWTLIIITSNSENWIWNPWRGIILNFCRFLRISIEIPKEKATFFLTYCHSFVIIITIRPSIW
jgi:hypothetical protein